MTDLDLLTGAIAARIRTLPQVPRLYPTRRTLLPGAAGSALGVLTALASDDTVSARLQDGVTAIEVDLAVAMEASAPETARAVAGIVRGVLDGAGIADRRITVRIASVET